MLEAIKQHFKRRPQLKLISLLILTISSLIAFMFYPYKTNYYECAYHAHSLSDDAAAVVLTVSNRSLVVHKYLFNKFSLIVTEQENTENVFGKNECIDDSESGLTIECDRKEQKIYHKFSFNQINRVLEEEVEFDAGGYFYQTHYCNKVTL